MVKQDKAPLTQDRAKAKDDTIIEWQFVRDYGEFALRMNFLAAAALLKGARSQSNADKRKSICLSGLQLLYSSLEDYAIMLHAFRQRASEGKHFHLSIGVEDRGRFGSTDLPSIYKRFESARQYLDNLGLKKVTYQKVAKFFPITKNEFEAKYRDLAVGIRKAADYQEGTTAYKNKLKHGKPVLKTEKDHPDKDDVLFPRWVRDKESTNWILEHIWVKASLGQFELAIGNIAQIYIRSLELLWLFMLNYYPQSHEDFARNVMVPCILDCERELKILGVNAGNLTSKSADSATKIV